MESIPAVSASTSSALNDAVAYVDRWLSYRRQTLRLPGLTWAVGRAGQVVGSGAHGVANIVTREMLTPEHRFRVASQSKMFTAAAIGMLVDRGVLRFDDPIVEFLPELVGQADEVTVGDLIGHSSGLVRDGADASFWELAADFPKDADLNAIAHPVLPRGSRFKYSNIGFGLAGAVIERAAGRSYAAFAHAEILKPLGLDQTSVDLPAGSPLLATGHSSGRGGADRELLPHVTAAGLAPATGFTSTVQDMVTFTAALCRRGALLANETRQQMQTPRWEVPGQPPRHYGYGVAIAPVGDRSLCGHGGAYPGFMTITMFDAEDGLAVAVMTNAIDGPAQELASGIIRLIDLAISNGSDPDPAPRQALDRFTGRFSGLWNTYDVVQLGGRAVAIDPQQADPVATVVRLSSQPDGSLRIEDCPGFGPIGEPVQLEGDGLRFAGHLMRRETD